MIQATDFISRVQPKSRKVNPNVTIKEVNIEFLDKVADERDTNRSSALDQLLDFLREQYEAAKTEARRVEISL
ncbi:MAG: hypothetical protein L0287_07890 [Anaerolineae bacterium]|nr:hypothetical protein [Anaerolineae bacterium]